MPFFINIFTERNDTAFFLFIKHVRECKKPLGIQGSLLLQRERQNELTDTWTVFAGALGNQISFPDFKAFSIKKILTKYFYVNTLIYI